MKTLNVTEVADANISRSVYNITSCVPLGVTLEEIMDGIPCYRMYYILGTETMQFLMYTTYIDLLEDADYLNIKDHDLYSGSKIIKHFISLFPDVSIAVTDMQFFTHGSPALLQNKPTGDVSIIGYMKKENQICRFELSNPVFLKISAIHESIMYLDTYYSDEDIICLENIRFTKVFETSEIIDIDLDKYSYKLTLRVQDSNRSKYILSVNMPFDEFSQKDMKKIEKFLKKKGHSVYMDPSIYDKIHILTEAYINGISNAENMIELIRSKNSIVSMSIMFIFCENGNDDVKIFYFDHDAKEKLSKKIKEFIKNI